MKRGLTGLPGTRLLAVCILAAVTVGATAVSTGARAADGDDAVALVRALYAAHAKNFAGDGPSVLDGGPAAQRYFDPGVAALMRVRELGFDPLYDGQDAEITELRIGPDLERAELRGTIFVRATFRNFGKPIRLVYLLRRIPGGEWRIIDIEAEEWRLSGLLSDAD